MNLAPEITRKLKLFFQELSQWIPGLKHPSTPSLVFTNLRMMDRQRTRAAFFCGMCGYMLDNEAEKRKELVFECSAGRCLCPKPYPNGLKSHQVCDACEAMFRSIYINYFLKNRNYFKEIDETEKKDDADTRRRAGL